MVRTKYFYMNMLIKIQKLMTEFSISRFYTSKQSQALSLTLITLLSLFSPTAMAKTLDAFVDNNIIQMGQFINLSVKLSDKSASSDPDFSILHQDFDVHGSASRSSETRIINGSMSSSTTWSLTISPKRQGAAIIPPFTLAGLSTQAITIIVGQASVTQNKEAYFEVETNKSNVYVQEQILFKYRLYIKMLDFSDTVLSEIKVENGMLIQNGDARQSKINKGGVPYHLVEKEFFIFPEKSGEITIPSISFQTVVSERGSRFSRYGTRRKLSAKSKPLTIKVKPVPSSYPKTAVWLPASNLNIKESIKSGDKTALHEFEVGEAITRTLITQATGLPASSLTPIHFESTKDLKVYADQGNTEDTNSTSHLIGKRSDVFAMLPTRSGNIKLPGHQIAWWDVKADKLRYAKIESHSLKVRENEDTPGAAKPLEIAQINPDSEKSAELKEEVIQKGFDDNEFILTIIIAVIIWILTVAGFLIYISKIKSKPSFEAKIDLQPIKTKEALNLIKGACLNRDKKKLRELILDWAQIVLEKHQSNGLESIANAISSDLLSHQLQLLDRALYSPEQENIEIDFDLIQKEIFSFTPPVQTKLNPHHLQALYSVGS